jgi:glycosyltransferase involved in cell wall biosynthesis
MPRVSVIIPVRDQGRYLGASLASVFRQSFRDFEVIVVDDGSEEDLAPVLAPYADRIHVERQSPQGVAAATNRGAALARGELLAFHDADDVMEPGRIAVPLARLDAEPRLDLVFGNGIRIDERDALLGPVIPERQARALARHGLRLADLLRRSLVYLQASLVRRRTFEELGGLSAFPAGADWGFVLRCLLHHPVAFVDTPLFRYRQHASSLTAQPLLMAEAAVAVLRDLAARDPAVIAQAGANGFRRALARRLARLAAQEARAGRVVAARTHLAEATSLAPYVVKYQLRLARLRLRASS